MGNKQSKDMSTIGLFYVIGGIISAIIAVYWFYNTGGEEQPIKVVDLLAFVWIAIFAFLVSWAGVFTSLLVKYGDVVIIKSKKGDKQ